MVTFCRNTNITPHCRALAPNINYNEPQQYDCAITWLRKVQVVVNVLLPVCTQEEVDCRRQAYTNPHHRNGRGAASAANPEVRSSPV